MYFGNKVTIMSAKNILCNCVIHTLSMFLALMMIILFTKYVFTTL